MTPDTAEDILNKAFKEKGMVYSAWKSGNPHKERAVLEAMKEIASLAWEAGIEFEKEEDRSFVRFIPRVSKEDFIKGLFP